MRQQSRHLPAFILLFLGQGPLQGGALQSKFSAALPSLKVDSGALYRTLQQLEKDGCLISEWNILPSGPPQKNYRLTELGWSTLDSWVEDIKQRLSSLEYFLETYKELSRPGFGR